LQYKLKRSPKKKKSSANLFYKDNNFTSSDAKILLSGQSKKIFDELSRRTMFSFGLKEILFIVLSKLYICKRRNKFDGVSGID